MYNQSKSAYYYLSLLGDDLIIYLTGLTRREIPFSVLIVFALGFLIVPLTKIDKTDVISGLLYGCYGMLSAALCLFMPPNYLRETKDIGKLTFGLFIFSIPALYFWFKDYGKIKVVPKKKLIDHELRHANDAFEEAINEGQEI